jgi:thiol:disulfide interchange protein
MPTKKIISLIFLIIILSACQQAGGNQVNSVWKPYSKEALAGSINQHKPVVIDFYADWCPNCHDLDRDVFADPSILAQLAKVTTLRVDVTNMDDPGVQNIVEGYGVDGVPTVIFVDGHGHEITDSRVVGAVTSREFAQSLDLLMSAMGK